MNASQTAAMLAFKAAQYVKETDCGPDYIQHAELHRTPLAEEILALQRLIPGQRVMPLISTGHRFDADLL